LILLRDGVKCRGKDAFGGVSIGYVEIRSG
jgi:hypothetical protein